jgi:hypothetical protein
MLHDNQFLKVRSYNGIIVFMLYISNSFMQKKYKYEVSYKEFEVIKDKPMYLAMVIHYLQKKVNA